MRRTLIALPHDRCVHVAVDQHDAPPALRLGGALVGEALRQTEPADLRPLARAAVDDGRRGAGPARRWRSTSPRPAASSSCATTPTTSTPAYQPDWPGYPVYLEERPDTTGLPRAEAKTMVREWRARRKVQERDKQRIDRLMGGPCTAKR